MFRSGERLSIMRSKGLLLALAIAVAGLTGLVLHGLTDPAGPGARPGWPTGSRYDYRLVWQAASEVAGSADPGIPAFGSTIDLEATLRLTSHGAHENGWLVAASFVSVPKPNVELLGSQVLTDPAALVGPTAWVVLDIDGRVARMYFEPSAPQVFKHLMQTVIGLGAITSGDGNTWRAVEPGPSGIARVVYRRAGTQWTRDRVAYDQITAAPAIPNAQPTLDAHAAITVDAGGHLATLVDDESLVVRIPNVTTPVFHGTSKFSMTLIARGDGSIVPIALANLESRAPGELVQSGDVEQALREQRAAGMTRDELVGGLGRAWGTASSAKRRWLHRAVAMLQLHPELCDDVLDVFSDGDDQTKLLAFDVLAAAGSPEAQAAMRDGLALPAAHGLEVKLVQRFSFVGRPDATSSRYVLATWQGATGDVATAAGYTVGAIARRVSETDGALAAELGDHLRKALGHATSTTEREHLITALGNTALADNVPVLREQARDASPDIRARAAWALRDMATADARKALLDLATDADARVARSALRAMGRQPLDGADLARLEEALRGPLPDATVAALIELLSLHLEDGATRRMLEVLAARTSNNHLQARARVLLSQLAS